MFYSIQRLLHTQPEHIDALSYHCSLVRNPSVAVRSLGFHLHPTYVMLQEEVQCKSDINRWVRPIIVELIYHIDDRTLFDPMIAAGHAGADPPGGGGGPPGGGGGGGPPDTGVPRNGRGVDQPAGGGPPSGGGGGPPGAGSSDGGLPSGGAPRADGPSAGLQQDGNDDDYDGGRLAPRPCPDALPGPGGASSSHSHPAAKIANKSKAGEFNAGLSAS